MLIRSGAVIYYTDDASARAVNHLIQLAFSDDARGLCV